jgi:pimeloyl-ACP methyl ester carboxylesterase
MMSGWPDDTTSAWGPTFLELMGKDYDILSLCYPGYDTKSLPPTKPLGYGFDEVTEMAQATIRQNFGEDCEPFFMLGFDWGVCIAELYRARYPEKVKKLVFVDVASGNRPQNSTPMDGFKKAYYVLIFALTFLAKVLLGSDLAANIVLAFFFIPVRLFPWLSPITRSEGKRRGFGLNNIHPELLYPYYYFMMSLVVKTFNRLPPFPFPPIPVYYIFGGNKNVMYHGKDDLSRLKATPGSGYLALPNAGHWCILDEPQLCFDAIRKFFV